MKIDFRLKMEFGIVSLLRLGWIAGILPILIAYLPSSPFQFIHKIVVISAGRGKIIQTSSRFSKLNVPQKFFCHFYALAVVWTSLLLLSTWVYAHKMGLLVSESTSHSSLASYLTGGSHIFSIQETHSPSAEHSYRVWRSVFLLLLMEIQVFWRLYESLYVFKYSSTARMHVLGYLTGIYFYTAASLSLCCNSAPEVFDYVVDWVTEYIVQGKDSMPPLEFQWSDYLSPLLKIGWCPWVGAAIFFWGWLHQRQCHAILGNLRSDKEKADAYAIPHGDWFEIVSSAHYLAEIVMLCFLNSITPIPFLKKEKKRLLVSILSCIFHRGSNYDRVENEGNLCWSCGCKRSSGFDSLVAFWICGGKSCVGGSRDTSMVQTQVRQLSQQSLCHYPIHLLIACGLWHKQSLDQQHEGVAKNTKLGLMETI